MTADELRARYPNASERFIALNAKPRLAAVAPRLRHAKPQRSSPHEPLAADEGKGKGKVRHHVRFERCACALLDKDNLYGSVKFACDALRYLGLIRDDDPDSIELTVTQRRVRTRRECGTHISIEEVQSSDCPKHSCDFLK